MIRFFLYNCLLTVAAPLAVLFLFFSSRYRPLLHRFRPLPLVPDIQPLWIHASSVGEVHVARGLIAAFRQKRPDVPVVLTVSTLSGATLAKAILADVTVSLSPFDLRGSVRGFLSRIRPRLLAIVETEIWPNLVRETRRAGVNVVVVNGCISNLHYPSYKRFKTVMPPVFQYLSFVGAQDARYAERFVALGAKPESVGVTGNMKYDSVRMDMSAEKRLEIRQQNGFGRHDVILVFGSTRPGDEQLAADCYRQLKGEFPLLRVIIAPRHLQRVEASMTSFAGEDIVRRSEIAAGKQDCHASVFMLDTLGELVQFYGAATVAVIGGSFFPGVDGHNPLESAALGVPTVFGPHMGFFEDATSLLLKDEGAVQVTSADALLPALRQLLRDEKMRERMAARGRKAILNNKGAAERNVAAVLQFIGA